MYTHPDSIGHNFVDQFPEIFGKYEPIRFQFPKASRFGDFVESSSFLFGSQGNKDVGMIYSAVQRAYLPDYLTFDGYLMKKRVRSKLLWVLRESTLEKRLTKILEEYHAEYGMKRTINRFYLDFLSPEDRKILRSKIYLPPQLVKGDPNSDDDQIKSRLDILLDFRNKLTHAASYTPFSDGKNLMPQSKDDQTWFMKLSFEEFYEITRKALANFWIQEYETYLSNGGKDELDLKVKRLMKELGLLNSSKMKLD